MHVTDPARGLLVRKNTTIMGLGNYIKETKGELSHVNWPTRRQTVLFTATVIVISVAAAAYLGLFDFIFSQGLKQLIAK